MVRWVSSEYEAILRLIKFYDLIIEDLKKNSNNTEDSDWNTRNKAQSLLKRLKGKKVVHILHFLGDLLKIVPDISKILQDRNELISSIHSIIEHLIEILNLLKNNDVVYLNEFHHYCSHWWRCKMWRRWNIGDKDIMFKNHDLYNNNLENLWLFRDNLIDSKINEFNQYFHTEDLNFLRIFEPKLIH